METTVKAAPIIDRVVSGADKIVESKEDGKSATRLVTSGGDVEAAKAASEKEAASK